MSRRASISVTDDRRWVFNRLAVDYRARPGYPEPLVERLLELAGGAGARVADLGAGIGHLSIPLARSGAEVWAVEPARAMLDALVAESVPRITPVHATAEETGLGSGHFDAVVLADAIQWVDPDRAGREAGRLLRPGGVLAVVVPRLAETPFMRELGDRIAAANFKARPGEPPVELFFSLAGSGRPVAESFDDEVLLEPVLLARVLRSLSFVGPALAPAAVERLVADAQSLAERHGGARWKRSIGLHWTRG